MAASGQAALIPIPNGDFETSVLTYTNVSNSNLGGGWMKVSGAGTTYAGIDVIDGTKYPSGLGNASGKKLIMQYAGAGNATRIEQVKSPALGNALGTAELYIAANSTYTITVAVGNKTGSVFIGSGSENQTRNGVEVLLDGTARAIKRFDMGTSTTANQLPPSGTDGTWADFSMSFTTDATGVVTASTGSGGFTGYTMPTLVGQNILGQTMRLRFRTEAYSGTGGQTIEVDNVRIDVVPEPATMGLLAMGGLGVLVRRRRR